MATGPPISKFSIECRVGRLVEARLEALGSVADVADFFARLKEAFVRAGHDAVVCGDWRLAQVLAPDVGDALVDLLRESNPRVLRGAILLSPAHPTFTLQVERLIKEANNPRRRSFRDPQQLLAWLGSALAGPELARAREFLSRSPSNPEHLGRGITRV